ncbi:MAG: hypothetical protein EHJ95_02335 [Methanobacteriota archaeon]|nr:MAG: hypothetical protein EHJ95_02335 [Euryarchaeota archaeon]
MANAEVTDVWMGSATDRSRQLAGSIPRDSLKKVFYGVKGTLGENEPVQKLVVGVMVDGQLTETFRIDITRRNAGQENPYWFSYPEEKKTGGEHTVQLGIGTTDDVDEKNRTVKKWTYGTSSPRKFNIA